MKITIVHEITSKRIADMMATGIEGGMSNQWCAGIYLTGALKNREDEFETADGYPWYCNPALYEREDFAIEVCEIIDEDEEPEGDNIKHHICRHWDFKTGIEYMARACPRHFHDLVQENDDAVTGDVFIQCIALKEIVYG